MGRFCLLGRTIAGHVSADADQAGSVEQLSIAPDAGGRESGTDVSGGRV
jgi:hypothetical protein